MPRIWFSIVAAQVLPVLTCMAQHQLPCWPRASAPPSGELPEVRVTILPQPGSTDDSYRIQQAIYHATGSVSFKAGRYLLKRPVCLMSYLSYIGEGGGDLKQGSILQGAPGQPIFAFDGNLESVTITGLTFDGRGAKAIAAANGRWLYNSTIRENYFSTNLAEGIYAPIQSTRIERNHFGTAGDVPYWPHRHIYSVPQSPLPGAALTNQNWIVNNRFFHAYGSESVRFEQGVQLHITGNQFEKIHAATTLQINGLFQVVIEGNYFESNAGKYIMQFDNSPDNQIGNYIVRLENNYYNMDNVIDNFIFRATNAAGRLSATTVYMSYETGTRFRHSNNTRAEVTDQALIDLPGTRSGPGPNDVVPCILFVRSPLWFNDYSGRQLVFSAPTDPRQTISNALCRK
jgi:hypothetical protein